MTGIGFDSGRAIKVLLDGGVDPKRSKTSQTCRGCDRGFWASRKRRTPLPTWLAQKRPFL